MGLHKGMRMPAQILRYAPQKIQLGHCSSDLALARNLVEKACRSCGMRSTVHAQVLPTRASADAQVVQRAPHIFACCRQAFLSKGFYMPTSSE